MGDMTTSLWTDWTSAFYVGGVVWIPTMLMIVFRRKYPRWWFDWNLELLRFVTRVEEKGEARDPISMHLPEVYALYGSMTDHRF